MLRRGWVLGCVLIGMVLSLSLGCRFSSNASTESSKENASGKKIPLRVIATVGMVGDLVRAMGGEQVQVRHLMAAGVDPHLYRPTRDDTLAIRDADAVFYCGLRLEGKMSDLLTKASVRHSNIAVTDSIPKAQLLHPEGSDHADPHVWMDVSLWSSASASVARALQELLPDHREAIESRRKQWEAKLEKLDAFGKEVIGSIPQEKRVLITSHDAFQYFGRRYGIEVAGIQGISTDSEAGLKRIRELVDRIVTQKIEAVFVESSVPQDSVQALVRGAADRGHTLKIGGPLFSDSMGDDGTFEGTYEGMMVHNFKTIAEFLGGRIPEGGYRRTDP